MRECIDGGMDLGVVISGTGGPPSSPPGAGILAVQRAEKHCHHTAVAGVFTTGAGVIIGGDEFTPLQNVAGSPAVAMPTGRAPDGMPIGVHLSARRGQDRILLELASEYEAAHPFARIWD